MNKLGFYNNENGQEISYIMQGVENTTMNKLGFYNNENDKEISYISQSEIKRAYKHEVENGFQVVVERQSDRSYSHIVFFGDEADANEVITQINHFMFTGEGVLLCPIRKDGGFWEKGEFSLRFIFILLLALNTIVQFFEWVT